LLPRTDRAFPWPEVGWETFTLGHEQPSKQLPQLAG
jgi:hypothetical protein